MGMRRTVILGVLMLCIVAAPPAGAESSIVLPRPGQVGLEVGGGYGLLAKSGDLGNLYDTGATFVVRARYRMRYERAIGLSFESQTLDVRTEPPPFDESDPASIGPTRLSLILSGFEFYQLFGSRTKTTRMVMAGAGLAQARAKLNSGDTQLIDVEGEAPTGSGDGLYVSAGAGVERFFYRSWAWDLSTRYMAVFRNGKPNHDVQAALGVIFYASY
jgi:hypothetical protein